MVHSNNDNDTPITHTHAHTRAHTQAARIFFNPQSRTVQWWILYKTKSPCAAIVSPQLPLCLGEHRWIRHIMSSKVISQLTCSVWLRIFSCSLLEPSDRSMFSEPSRTFSSTVICFSSSSRRATCGAVICSCSCETTDERPEPSDSSIAVRTETTTRERLNNRVIHLEAYNVEHNIEMGWNEELPRGRGRNVMGAGLSKLIRLQN